MTYYIFSNCGGKKTRPENKIEYTRQNQHLLIKCHALDLDNSDQLSIRSHGSYLENNETTQLYVFMAFRQGHEKVQVGTHLEK